MHHSKGVSIMVYSLEVPGYQACILCKHSVGTTYSQSKYRYVGTRVPPRPMPY